MSDVLSQNEIDALLKQLSDGELDMVDIEEKPDVRIKEYDFSRPSKFSKEHLRTLEIIFEHFGRLLSSNLPAYLRKNIQVNVINAEAVMYSEFSNALSNPVLLGIGSMAPLPGNFIIEMATNIGYTIIDRLLGGVGEPLMKSRDFSEIEISILERIFSIMIELFREPWSNVVEIRPRLERIETNSQFAQIISPNEMIAIITINLNIGGVEGLINICLPYITLEKVMDKLNTKYWFSTMQTMDEQSYSDAIEAIITKAQIPISAELGRSRITVYDFMNLQVGDILKLHQKVEDELNIYVGNIVKFKALPGSFSEQYAVKITEIIREEE
ncbi:MAG: flagellar motor switch protein FliM [Eubacteriales bacterium]|nr:flagellar motor switch protein FliM [Lachnospiraceae bacterium]MDO5127812.1 flagellar motor switch protein FliM [Eubacteriales bacterium]